MKSRVIVWGRDSEQHKVLLALMLNPVENKIQVLSFPEDVVTAEFENLLNNEWKAEHEMTFPEGYKQMEVELTAAGSILPEGYSTDQEDLINRTQTEWQFRVLSTRLSENYKSELEMMKDKIGSVTQYEQSLWNELKGVWEKIQNQIREKFLLPEHIDHLRSSTNELFGQLKEKRKDLDKVFNDKSTQFKDEFFEAIDSIEERLNKGLSFQPIFEELKQIQQRFNQTKFSNPDRRSVWNKLDGAFKILKEKRYGKQSEGTQNNALDRLNKRYEGLLGAIKKMEKSIQYDEKELDFQSKRSDDFSGQLEVQIRQAKIKMTEERVNSKKEKLAEMVRTKEELEGKQERIQQNEKARAEKDTAKKAAEELVAAQIAAASAARAENENELEEKARMITESKKPFAEPEKLIEAAAEPKLIESPEVDQNASSEEKVEATVDQSNPNISNAELDIADDVATSNEGQIEEEKMSSASTGPLADEELQNESAPIAESPIISEAGDESIEASTPQENSSETSAEGENTFMENVTHSVEDAIDTVKAVASVLGDKLDDMLERFTDKKEEE